MSYKIKFDKFFSYSFSLDCVIFGLQNGEINVLLIKRAMEPFLGQFAIPGDLVYPDEDLPQAAGRILSELTHLEDIELHQGQTFGDPDRHPQGRVITNAFYSLVRMNDVDAVADSWAEEVEWAPVKNVTQLAFDHNKILKSTYELLCQKLRREPICFDLLPEKFTLLELQNLYEYALNEKYDKANFRKKIKPLPLINLKEKQQNVKHRPANLYKFDRVEFNRMVKEEGFLFRL